MTKRKSKTVTLELVDGVEGPSVYLADYRIAGPKPWGGGKVKARWKADVASVRRALRGRPNEGEK